VAERDDAYCARIADFTGNGKQGRTFVNVKRQGIRPYSSVRSTLICLMSNGMLVLAVGRGRPPNYYLWQSQTLVTPSRKDAAAVHQLTWCDFDDGRITLVLSRWKGRDEFCNSRFSMLQARRGPDTHCWKLLGFAPRPSGVVRSCLKPWLAPLAIAKHHQQVAVRQFRHAGLAHAFRS